MEPLSSNDFDDLGGGQANEVGPFSLNPPMRAGWRWLPSRRVAFTQGLAGRSRIWKSEPDHATTLKTHRMPQDAPERFRGNKEAGDGLRQFFNGLQRDFNGIAGLPGNRRTPF
jgi:hypothetical protein